MGSLSRAKTLGEVGSIFVLLVAVPSVGSLLGIIGFILLLIAINDVSEFVGDRSIFNDMLVAIGLAIVAIVVGALVIVGSVLRFVGLNALNVGPHFNPSKVPPGDWVSLVGSILIGLAVVWVVMIASSVYVRRSYNLMASKLKVGTFETAGLLYLIGAATTIILVGFVLLFVAQILVVVAFFSIDDKQATAAGQPSQGTTTIRAVSSQ